MDKGSPAAVASLGMPTFDDPLKHRQWAKEHMALAFRYLGREGYGKEGVAGHISLRDPVKPDHFWLNPLAKHFSQICVSDLVLVDHTGQIVEGEGGNNAPINAAAFAIHSAIHAAQPDVIAACHAHSIYGKAWATLGIELPITTQDSCIFYKDQKVYDSFGGVVFQAEEGQRIANALGDKRLLILQNHGLLTVGKTVDEAVFLFGAADRQCQAQLAADAAAAARGIKSIIIDDEDAAYTHSQIGRSDVHYIQFSNEVKYLHETTGGSYLQ
ncbi:class II aldolase/adducin N-terminal [Protomyces lactucae-debilis]|uniref:Class II aldolase/adducin N-terminal n=1 Tax=Protomyces lactucae-debilis TaxID=2754530 RepID=A0A1Y2F7T4_PROLT|nr:class II aldolase/adducin N-terminal [Protomyces lactucae-debilis]ORY79426.1 class II aldolase/adducin N-terminal [Protomyces lactucae-debilis]